MITTDRLTLRPLRPEDAPWIAREIAHPQVHRWLTSVPFPYRLEDAQDFVSGFADDPWFRVIAAQDQPCGVVSIADTAVMAPDRPPGFELGYWLRTGAHGHGYMTEAAQALVDAFFARHTDPLGSGWIEGNGPSENVLTKLGFTRTGEVRSTLVRFYADTRPVIRVRLTRDDWASRTLEAARTSG